MINFDRPNFITFEGGEGSGKSTQTKMLYKYLLSKSIKAIHTREIGGTVEAEKIRHLLVYSELLSVSELMLVMAARYEHINKVIIPALFKGNWVICDRFIDSTACYQSGKSSLPLEDIYDLHKKLMTVSYVNEIENIAYPQIEINDFESHGIMPDITFFMDIPPEEGLARVATKRDTNKFEDKNISFHKKIYERFQAIARLHEERIVSINCVSKTMEAIHKEICNKIFN